MRSKQLGVYFACDDSIKKPRRGAGFRANKDLPFRGIKEQSTWFILRLVFGAVNVAAVA
jgi:hypothetical protein